MTTTASLMEHKQSQNKINIVILGSSLITLCLYVVPILHPIAYPFVLLSTLAHEMGHGLGAILMGGNFESFQMFPDASGVAQISGNFGRFSKAFIAAMGLVGPALVAALFFSLLKSPRRSRAILGILGLCLSISIILVVRNIFGIFFIAALIFVCFFFSLGQGKNYAQSIVAFFAMQLSLSVFSRSDYLFTKTAMTNMGPMPSDVEQIAQNLFLPYWFWGGLLALLSVIVLFYGIRSIYK